MKIFLAYAATDKTAAESVAFSLRSRGHKVFLDRDDLPAGGSYDQQIERAVKASDIFVFLISPDSVTEGRYTLTELSFAREKWPDPNDHVLPVMARETPLDQIDPYLKAVTILKRKGSIAAETGAAVDKMRRRASRPILPGYRGVGTLFGFCAFVAILAVFFFGTQSRDLSGPWICYDLCQVPGASATIKQDGANLIFTNEVGARSGGRWVNSSQVIATDWNGLLGDLSYGGRVIQWHNPTRWVRPWRCFFSNACT
jgi:hypothetical protein